MQDEIFEGLRWLFTKAREAGEDILADALGDLIADEHETRMENQAFKADQEARYGDD